MVFLRVTSQVFICPPHVHTHKYTQEHTCTQTPTSSLPPWSLGLTEVRAARSVSADPRRLHVCLCSHRFVCWTSEAVQSAGRSLTIALYSQEGLRSPGVPLAPYLAMWSLPVALPCTPGGPYRSQADARTGLLNLWNSGLSKLPFSTELLTSGILL